MSYSLATLWYERQRFIPGVLAVMFSALLIALQCGLLLGLFSITSIPIDNSNADIWLGHPEVASVDVGQPIAEALSSYLSMPEVTRYEIFMQGFSYWKKPTGSSELCLVIGSRLSPDSLGAVKQLTPHHRMILAEYGSIVVDEGELWRLGIDGVGSSAEINGKRVKVVGLVNGLKSLAGPYVWCSVETARSLLRPPPDQTTFILAKTKTPEDAEKVVERLQAYPKKMQAFTKDGFSFRTRMHWLTKTKAGIAMGLAAALGLLVGAVVTSQTLYAATAASLREYAVLRALGIPRWRMYLTVLAQSFWVGVAGVFLSMPVIFGLATFGTQIGAKVLLPWPLLLASVVVTMTMALLSGLMALRSLRSVEPVTLLR